MAGKTKKIFDRAFSNQYKLDDIINGNAKALGDVLYGAMVFSAFVAFVWALILIF